MNKITGKKIHLKGKKFIGSGAYGRVFQISKRQVVKVFDITIGSWAKKERLKYGLQYARDEIKGSKIYKDAIKVLRIALVIDEDGEEQIGVVKPYIPRRATWKDLDRHQNNCPGPVPWDYKPDNYRKDHKNKVYRVDTQTPTMWDI